MRIVIIGASISGMMAAARWPDAVLLERGGPDELAPVLVATFYAHQRVPQFAENPITIQTYIDGPGTSRDYAAKVYGDPDAPVSLDGAERLSVGWTWNSKALFAAIQGRTHFRTPATHIDLDRKIVQTPHRGYPYDSLIVTAPLPIILRLTGLPLPPGPFRSETIYLEWTKGIWTLPSDRLVVRYYPTMAQAYYRTNQRGEEVEREYTERHVPAEVREQGRVLRPGKIWAHPAAATCVALLEQLGVYCVGRYARWEQKWLSTDTWSEIRKMEL